MKYINIFLITACFLITTDVFADIENGRQLYNANCAACHHIGGGDFVGPDLHSVTEMREESWLIPFIRSSQTMIREGDELAVALYEEYNRLVMPDFPGLSDADIKDILVYIDHASEESDAVREEDPDDASPYGAKGDRVLMYKADYDENRTLIDIVYWGGMATFIVIALVLGYYIAVVSKIK